MQFGKDRVLERYKWHVVVIGFALIIAVLLIFFTSIFETSEEGVIPQRVWLVLAALFLVVVILILTKAFKIIDVLHDNAVKLEKIAEALEKNRSFLMEINKTARLSETAKAIAFRDAEIQALREAVFDKLQQHDFEATNQIIDEIAARTGYRSLAEQLRLQATRYQEATDQERINQVIEHIEKLFENYEWAKASMQIERLIKAAPNSEKAKAMRQSLIDKKEDRKKVLLTAWDDAVRRQATDRSLEILRDLDPYLTPNEGLALQEAARDVFRTKLHNLGVQFSLAISGRQWAQAIQIGQQIVRDFPNSRMAEEIREKMDVLRQKTQQRSS